MPLFEAIMMSKICPKEIAALFVVVVAVGLNATMARTAAQSAGEPAGQEASASKQSLDFEFFKTRVEPIFLKRRGDHARCYVCHSVGSGAPQYLVKLSPGSTFWTDDQSRRIFQNVSKLVDR